jgi:hypothetical protein
MGAGVALNEITIKDLGGAELDPSEMFTDDIVAYVNNLDTTLGTKADPHYNEYKAFENEINSARIITIDTDSIDTSHKFDDIDLSGDNEEVPDLPKDYFMMFMGSILFKSTGNGPTPYDLKSGDQFAFADGPGVAPWDDFTVPFTK